MKIEFENDKFVTYLMFGMMALVGISSDYFLILPDQIWTFTNKIDKVNSGDVSISAAQCQLG